MTLYNEQGTLLARDVYVYVPTTFGLTAAFKVNTTILGTFSMPKRLNTKHIDMNTDSKIA